MTSGAEATSRPSATPAATTRAHPATGSAPPSNPAATAPTPGVPATSAAPDRAYVYKYPLHTNIPATTFWVGEIFDPNAPDGSQVISTYDSHWLAHYGGCDGVRRRSKCTTQARIAANGYFPRNMTPKLNPFYLDLPFDDLNDPVGFRTRCAVVPWARLVGYGGRCDDRDFSYLKNRWVQLTGPNKRTCYGQIEDAGPGQYHDSNYVFSTTNTRPRNKRYGGAGLDVSPALNGCLGFAQLDGDNDHVSWRFVENAAVPAGPWRRIITTSSPS